MPYLWPVNESGTVCIITSFFHKNMALLHFVMAPKLAGPGDSCFISSTAAVTANPELSTQRSWLSRDCFGSGERAIAILTANRGTPNVLLTLFTSFIINLEITPISSLMASK